jgi:hypothetical protein
MVRGGALAKKCVDSARLTTPRSDVRNAAGERTERKLQGSILRYWSNLNSSFLQPTWNKLGELSE